MNAIVLAGAGAAYLSSGLGPWEFAFCTLMSIVAYKLEITRNYFFAFVLELKKNSSEHPRSKSPSFPNQYEHQ